MISEDDPAEDVAVVAVLEPGIALIEMAASQAPPKESNAASRAHPSAFISSGSFMVVA